MKKINENGFVLAEGIVVAVFVLGMFTLLITTVLPLISKYEKVLDYDNPEDIYSVNLLADAWFEYDSIKNIADDLILCSDRYQDPCWRQFTLNEDGTLPLRSATSLSYYIDGNYTSNSFCNNNYCIKLFSKNYLNVKNILFINMESSEFLNRTLEIGNTCTSPYLISCLNRANKEYINYFLKQHSDVDSGLGVLVSFRNGKYAGIIVPKGE